MEMLVESCRVADAFLGGAVLPNQTPQGSVEDIFVLFFVHEARPTAALH